MMQRRGVFNERLHRRKKPFLAALGVLVLLGAGTLAALAGPLKEKPDAVVGKYFAALRQGDYATAYRYASRREYRETFGQFTQRVARYPKDADFQVTRVERQDSRALVYVRYSTQNTFGTYESTGTMELVSEGLAWRIVAP